MLFFGQKEVQVLLRYRNTRLGPKSLRPLPYIDITPPYHCAYLRSRYARFGNHVALRVLGASYIYI